MPVEHTTPNRGYQLPFGSNDLADDVLRLIAALSAIDVDIAGLLVSVAQRALLVHSHVIADTTGLQAALDSKQDGSDKGNANGYASLGADGKVPAAQLPATLFGSLNYQGDWNANTNTPTIPAAAAGNKGWYYLVSVAGTTSVGGITDWKVGDWAVSEGTKWTKIDNTDAVSSVAGKVGAVTLQITDITDMSPNGRSLTQAANYAAMKTLLACTVADISGLQAGLDAKAGTAIGNTFSAGQQVFAGGQAGNGALGLASGTGGEIEVRGNGTGAAKMAFHRPSAFAAFLGIDTDNKWKVGGWSMGNAAYEIVHMGNFTSLLDARYALLGSGSPNAVLEDQKASGTAGGSAIAGSWQTRDLNTEVRDPAGLISIASNAFTPTVPGWVEWSAPAWATGNHQTRLFNATDGVVVAYGSSERAGFGADGVTRSTGGAPVAAGKAYRIEHQVISSRATTGYGFNNGFGTEVYSRVKFWRT